MASPHVIEYLRTHTLYELYENHGVKFRVDALRTKISLNYDQLKLKAGDIIAECCRGLIIRPDFVCRFGSGRLPADDAALEHMKLGQCHVVSRPMDKFYNYGEHGTADVDQSTMNVLEKLDDTMCHLYFDRFLGQWCVATRSIPDADLPIRQGDIVLSNKTFSDVFWEAFDATVKARCSSRADALDDLMVGYTYVFELTTPQNRIVVKYDESKVTLIAVRQTRTGQELNIFIDHRVRQLPFPRPRTWHLNDPIAIAARADSFDPTKLEGFVTIDNKFRRVKIKNSLWASSSKMKDSATNSKRNAVLAAFKGTLDDIMPLVDDESREYLMKVKEGIREYVDATQIMYNRFAEQCEPGDYKTFASLVNAAQPPIHAAYFMTFRGRCKNVREFFDQATANGRLTRKTLDVIIQHLGL